jgi:cell division protein ZapA
MTAEQPRQAPGRVMSQVTVTINGRQFRMACEDGQEGHLRRLASDLDERIEKLRKSFGEIGDTRLTVMAALTLADELAEAGDKLRGLEVELAVLHEAREASGDHAKATQAAVANALNAAAERIESITQRLNLTRVAEESASSEKENALSPEKD